MHASRAFDFAKSRHPMSEQGFVSSFHTCGCIRDHGVQLACDGICLEQFKASPNQCVATDRTPVVVTVIHATITHIQDHFSSCSYNSFRPPHHSIVLLYRSSYESSFHGMA